MFTNVRLKYYNFSEVIIMTTALAIRTFFEIAAVVLVALGIFYEDKMANFEHNVARIIKRKIRMYHRRKAIEKRRAQGKHLRVASDRKRTTSDRARVA